MNVPINPPPAYGLPHQLEGGSAMPPGGAHFEGAKSFDPHQLIARARRRLRLSVSVAVVVFAAVAFFTLQATPKYTANASVMLDTRKEQVSNVQQVLSDLPNDTSVVDTEVEVMRSRHLADRVVDTLHLENDAEFNPTLRPPSPAQLVASSINDLVHPGSFASQRLGQADIQRLHEKVVDNVLNRLQVHRVGLTYVIDLSFTSTAPIKAAQIANKFADLYQLEQLEAKFDATKQANDWLNGRLTQLRGQVQEAEAQVEQYKIANNLLSASGTTLTEQEISNYNQQASVARTQEAEDEARLNTARQQLAGGSTGEDVGEALGSEVIQKLREQRVQISGRVADLQGRYGPRHPEMLKAQRELNDIDSQIQAEIKRIISNLEAKVEVSRERAASIQGTQSAARGTLAQNNRASVRLRELERNANSIRTLYESFLNRFKETSSEVGIGQSDTRIVSHAKIPITASSPKILLNLAAGLLLSLGMGAMIGILAEMWDSGIATGEEVDKRLHVPYLGGIPLLSSVASGDQDPVDHIVDKPLSSFSESFRNLRAAAVQSRLGSTVKVVAITSALPGEGKTVTSVCLARSLALGGARTIIVDCDLRRRSINRTLNLRPKSGLLEVLNGEAPLDEVILQDDKSSAKVLPLSTHPFMPRDVFDSPAMDQLLEELRSRFDFVVLDMAPVLPVADARVLAPKADAVIFLARWRKTPERATAASLRILAGANAYVSGVVLTQINMKLQARHGYGDGSYYYGLYKQYYTT